MISAVKLVKDQSYTLLLLRARSRYHKYHGALINGKQANKQTSKQANKQEFYSDLCLSVLGEDCYNDLRQMEMNTISFSDHKSETPRGT